MLLHVIDPPYSDSAAAAIFYRSSATCSGGRLSQTLKPATSTASACVTVSRQLDVNS